MRLSKLTGFLSGLGASLVLGFGSAMATPTEIEAEATGGSTLLDAQRQTVQTPPKNNLTTAMAAPVQRTEPLSVAKQTELQSQRENLAENPLCRLASELEEQPPEVFTNTVAAQAPSKFSGFVSGFLRKLLQVMGLEQFIHQQTVPTPKVAVVPKPLVEDGEVLAAQPVKQNSAARLVSTSQPSPVKATQNYQLWVKGHLVADIRSQEKANLLAQRLERLVDTAGFSPLAITPTMHNDQPAIAMGGQILFVVDESLTREDVFNHEVLAIRWANNLRLALNAPALDLATAQKQMYQIEETNNSLEGLASWYGPYFHGRLTANGETYDQYAFTAAHPSMPLNTYLKVTNLNNDQSVIIRLNDRGPYIEPRSLDLSLGAARCLNSVQTGVIPYKATIMKRRPAIAAEAI